MKILVISDIHGAKDSALKVKELMERSSFDKIFCLGDINYHGPRNPLPHSYEPKEVIPILNSFKDKIIAVKGNCDADVDDMMYDFDLKEYLKAIPFNDQKIFLSHGHVYNEDNLPALKKGDIFMYGHTHIPVIKYENGYYIFNPGSLTLPKGGHERTYGVLDDNGLYIYTIDDRLYMECHFKSDDR